MAAYDIGQTTDKDLYAILGVDRQASEEEIHRAFRKLARDCHPDMNPDDPSLEERFKEINEAHEVLSDPQRRAAYDLNGTIDGNLGFGAGVWNADDFTSAFNAAYGGGSDDYDEVRRNVTQQRGETLEVHVRITLEEARHGCTKSVEYVKEDACPNCNGTGDASGATPILCPECRGHGYQIREVRRAGYPVRSTVKCHSCGGSGRVIRKPCTNCNATGRTRQRKKVSLPIPKGIEDGHILILKNAGNLGYNGGEKGDLRVVINVMQHEMFDRDGTCVRSTKNITFYQAAMGSTVTVNTIDGATKLALHPGTQSGEEFIIPNAGMPDLETGICGDHIVTVHVDVPVRMNARQKELLKQWAIAMAEDVDGE